MPSKKSAINFLRLFIPVFIVAGFFYFGFQAKADEPILYQDDFSTGQATGWLDQSDPGSTWQVEDGKYHLTQNGGNLLSQTVYQSGFSWKNYSYSFDIDLNDGVDRNVIFRMQDSQNYFSLGLRGYWYWSPTDTPVIYIQKCYQGQCTGHQYYAYFAAYHFSDPQKLNHETAHIDIQAVGNEIKAFYNGVLVIDWQEPTDNYPQSGTIGFYGWTGGYGVTDASLYNLLVKELPDATLIPTLSNLGQYKSDSITQISEGSSTIGSAVVFQGTLTSPSGNPAQLQVEVQPVGTAFTGTPTATSVFSSTWGIVSVSVPNLPTGQYHWQARVVDSQNNASAWQEFGTAGNVDFTILRNPVILIPGILGSQKVSGVWVMDPILHTYDNLWQALKLAGYEEDKTLFSFPYDWRQSNASSSLLLKQKINDAKAACNAAQPSGYDCSKVDLVAHSMGGIVARTYIEGANYQNDADQLIFLATPQQGSPKAYLAWEGGSMGKGYKNGFIEEMLNLQASYESAKYRNTFDYVRNFPIKSVQELLPIYNYLIDKGSTDYRVYPNNYPVNSFLESLNASANLSKLTSIKITNILADAGSNNTINGLRLVNQNFSNGQWENGYPENYNGLFGDHGLIMGDGDDTVPKISNSNFLGQQDVVIENSSHLDIPTDAQKEVIKDLTGVLPQAEVRRRISFSSIANFLIFAIYSPADFVVTSPDGQQLGNDFTNNTEINQIPNAYYSGTTDDPEFVVIPNPVDGQYKVELQAKNGGGNYHVEANYISQSTTTAKDFSANIAPGNNQIFNLDCASNSPQSIVTLAPQDIVPPAIVVKTPTSSVQYFHSDKLRISYTATDDFSGVASVTVAIDGDSLTTTTVDLFSYTLGTHQVSIKATDNAGNQAVKTVNFKIVASIGSTIYDIKTAYSKKWLNKESDEQTLVAGFNVLKQGINLLDATKAALKN
jgi:hypothetical protein